MNYWISNRRLPEALRLRLRVPESPPPRFPRQRRFTDTGHTFHIRIAVVFQQSYRVVPLGLGVQNARSLWIKPVERTLAGLPSVGNFHVAAGGRPCRTLPQLSKPEQARYLRCAPVFSGAGYPAQNNRPAGYYVRTPGRSEIGLCYGEHHSDRCLRDNKNFLSERPRARARVFLLSFLYIYIYFLYFFLKCIPPLL